MEAGVSAWEGREGYQDIGSRCVLERGHTKTKVLGTKGKKGRRGWRETHTYREGECKEGVRGGRFL